MNIKKYAELKQYFVIDDTYLSNGCINGAIYLIFLTVWKMSTGEMERWREEGASTLTIKFTELFERWQHAPFVMIYWLD